MKHIRKISALLLTVLLLISLASCGAGSGAMSDSAYNKSEMEYFADQSKPGTTGSGTLDASAAADSSAEFASKIIRRVDMHTETREYDRALTELSRMITESGGFVESSSSNGQSLGSSGMYSRSAKFVIRIPAEKLDGFLASAGELLNVTSSNITSENVTTTYYDIQSRLEVLRTEKDTLNGMLEKANTVDEMLSIQDRLYNVIAEIESAETQLRLYDSLVSYSTVTMRVEEVVEYTKIMEEEPGWGERLWTAFVESWKDFAEGFQDFTVGFLYAIPTLMVMAVIITAIVLILRLLVRISRKNAAKHRGPHEPKQ